MTSSPKHCQKEEEGGVYEEEVRAHDACQRQQQSMCETNYGTGLPSF